MKVKLYKVFILVIILLNLLSCATSSKNSIYKTLAVSKETRNALLSSASELHKNGVISDEDVDKIISISQRYDKAHNAAVSALLRFESGGMYSDEADLYKAMSVVSSTLSELITVVSSYKSGGVR